MIEKSDRNLEIDLLRGIAILLVLILHFQIAYHLDQSALNKILTPDFIKAITGNGNYGVTMFFVISGYLITSTSIERYGSLSKIDIIQFYLYRFARIMPCLILAITLILLFNHIHIPIFANKPNTTSLFLAIFSVLTFWHNVLMDKIGYFNYCLNIFWSLSVEEIFYLTFPISCLCVKRTNLIMILWTFLIVLAPIYRSLNADNEIIALYEYLSCFDAIAIGCCTAILCKRIRLNIISMNIMKFAAWSLLVLVYFHVGIMENVVFGVSLIAFSTALLIFTAVNNSTPKASSPNVLHKAISWFGENSYELYLFHIIVLAIMKYLVKSDQLNDYTKVYWLAIFLIISSIVAQAISKYYSGPINIMLRKGKAITIMDGIWHI